MVAMGGMNYAPIDPANIFKTALADREASQAISFSQKLEEKSREAEGINSARAMDRQQVISPQERQAI